MFGISMWELGLIILVALILLGPRQLTETARVLGRLYREVTKLTSELRSSIDLDSITSTPSSTHHVEPDPARTEPQRETKDDMDLVAAPPGERSGLTSMPSSWKVPRKTMKRSMARIRSLLRKMQNGSEKESEAAKSMPNPER